MHDKSDHDPASTRIARFARIAFWISVYAMLLGLGHFGGAWLGSATGLEPGASAAVNKRALWTGLAAFAILLAIPFVPGIEISLALFAAFGSAVAIHVYVASVVALTASYLVGRLVPTRVVGRAFKLAGLHSAEALLARLEPLDDKQRLLVLTESAPSRFVPFLIRYRYLAVAIALNLPGNAVLGGGGGIALLAGVSRLFSPVLFLLAIGIALLPIPLAVLLAGRWF